MWCYIKSRCLGGMSLCFGLDNDIVIVLDERVFQVFTLTYTVYTP